MRRGYNSGRNYRGNRYRGSGYRNDRNSKRYQNYQGRDYDRRGLYDDYDDYDDFKDTTTGKLVSKMTKSKEDTKQKKKNVVCNNVEHDSCLKSGIYKNIKTGERIRC